MSGDYDVMKTKWSSWIRVIGGVNKKKQLLSIEGKLPKRPQLKGQGKLPFYFRRTISTRQHAYFTPNARNSPQPPSTHPMCPPRST
eukprot:scaffold42474_cov73-Cyclotella_meneghiniana.AAC.6